MRTNTSSYPRPSRPRRGQPGKPGHPQADLHGELFSIERLEEYAREIAEEHKATTRQVPARPLLAEAEESGRVLEAAYSLLADADGPGPNSAGERLLMPGDEWLLDNYHIVRDTIDEIRVDLPRRYYLQLPRLGEGSWGGYPRVYAAVRELILHTDGIVDSRNTEAFIRGYQ